MFAVAEADVRAVFFRTVAPAAKSDHLVVLKPLREGIVGRVHGEVFAGVRPAATMVEVSRLIDPALLVEIEVDAVVGGEG